MAARFSILYLLSFFSLVLTFAPGRLLGQHNLNFPDTVHKPRLTGVVVIGSALYIGSQVGLYTLWYSDYPQSSFHFTNDSRHWMGVDKIGHTVTSYYIGRIGYAALRWSGIREKPAIWIGGSLGFIFLTTVEVFDGFSAAWGASATDIVCNGIGTLFFIGQQFLWHDQRLTLKFSYHFTDYAIYNPAQLGQGSGERLMKDYNGHTYWLSGNIASFIRKESKFPAWLNIAFGYGARGMISAKSNPGKIDGTPVPPFNRIPQYYLSLDIDLTRIRTKSQFLNLLLNLVGFIKIPLPTVEYNREDQFKFHFIYF